MAKPTTANTFPLFPFFPYEIRRKIYLLATPPRFVYVWESPDFCDEDHAPSDDFVEYLARPATIASLKLDPSLAYFAHNWRRHVHWNNLPGVRVERQARLTSYGFTNRRAPYEPWAPTRDVPEVPIHWLVQQPELAFQFTRKSYLRSKTLVPPLLHTCAESREALTRYGYELTFGTRTHGPRTWFCYRHDTLYLYPDNNSSELLDGGWWNLGQFLPCDLTRVRRLALCPGRPRDADLTMVSNALRLLPGLEELFFVVCNLDAEICGWLAGDGKLWHWIDGDGADVRGAVAAMGVEVERDSILFVVADLLDRYTSRHGGVGSGFFDELARDWAETLTRDRERTVAVQGASMWNIPKVRIGHLGTEKDLRRLKVARDSIVLTSCKLKTS